MNLDGKKGHRWRVGRWRSGGRGRRVGICRSGKDFANGTAVCVDGQMVEAVVEVMGVVGYQSAKSGEGVGGCCWLMVRLEKQ